MSFNDALVYPKIKLTISKQVLFVLHWLNILWVTLSSEVPGNKFQSWLRNQITQNMGYGDRLTEVKTILQP